MYSILRNSKKIGLNSSKSILLTVRNFSRPSTSWKTNKTESLSTKNSLNEPIQFFGSEAAKWRARDTHSGGLDDVPWYQPYVVAGSIAIFLIYFCILREENDVDRKLDGTLFDQVSGLEELQLTLAYKHNKQNGLDTTHLERRLAELGIEVNALD